MKGIMTETLHLLQVEDSESDAELVVRLLRKAGYDVHSPTRRRPRGHARGARE